MVDFNMSSWKLSPVDNTIVSPLFLSLIRDYDTIIAFLKMIKLKIPYVMGGKIVVFEAKYPNKFGRKLFTFGFTHFT